MLRIFRRTITIINTETWTVSVESDQPIDLSPAEDERIVVDDETTDPDRVIGQPSNED